jgi:type VI secretion system protein
MSMVITITKAPNSVNAVGQNKTFSNDMIGTIGRGEQNTWVLDDPERYLSTTHCRISVDSGQFYITDSSTNGTFYNGSPNPMGKGAKQAVQDNDTFIIGDYEFSIALATESSMSDSQAAVFSSSPFESTGASDGSSLFADDDLFAKAPPVPMNDGFGQSSNPISSASPFDVGHVPNADSLIGGGSAETDPLVALDKARGQQSQPDFSHRQSDFASPFGESSLADNANPINQQVSWPNAVPDPELNAGSSIPDDWDDDWLSSDPSPAPVEPAPSEKAPVPESSFSTPVIPKPAQPFQPKKSRPEREALVPQRTVRDNSAEVNQEVAAALARQQTLENVNAKIQAELNTLKQKINTPQKTGGQDSSVDRALVNALGFEDKALSDAEISQINQLSGEVLREMVSGLMQVLGARSSIKNEFRMNVTTIQPVENNPLKFSANVSDALENMFLKQGNAYKKPVEAIQDSFEGIAEHQMAVLAGIKDAFSSVIERFDPLLLEERFAKLKKSGLLPGSQKARYWEAYHDYYQELAGDMDKSFQYLYGDGFVRAYESQLQKLALSRKAKKNNDA